MTTTRSVSALPLTTCAYFAYAGLACAGLACGGNIDGGEPNVNTGAGAGGDSAMPGAGASGGGAGMGGGGESGMGIPGVPGGGDCTPELLEARAVLSPLRQYQKTLRDLFGQQAVREEDESFEIEFEVIDRARMTTSMLDQVVRLAERATESLRGEVDTLLGCTALDDRDCVRTGLSTMARRAFKRPTEADEIDALMELYEEAFAVSNAATAAEDASILALTAIATSPSTLYRTEFEQAPGATERTLTAHERAAAIAALLLDSIPDDDLLAAADDRSLLEPAGISAQVTRLLALPRVRDHLTQVMLSAFKVPKLFQSPKDAEVFPEYTGELQVSMYEETRTFLEDVLWERGAPLSELLTSRKGFVDPLLADLYGVDYPGSGSDRVEVELPATRAGLLTQASVLSVLSRTDKTSVVARGLYVRGALLCLPKIGAPPAAVQAQVMAQLDADSSQAELAAVRATTQPCSGCHSQFDRFGLLLESFDAIGRELAPLDAPIDLAGLADFEGAVASPAELAQLLTEDTDFIDCMAERTLAYALSEASDTGKGCVPDALATSLHQAGDLQALISTVVAHPAFSTRALEGN